MLFNPVRHWRRLWAVLASAAVFAAVFFLRRYGILDGYFALAFGSLLACVMPWSTSLSRRILLSGAVFLGWMPLLWWVKLPVPQVDRVGIVLAAATGALVGWVLWKPDLRARAKRLVPRLAFVDAMPFAAAGLTAWMTWSIITVSDNVRMLGLFVEKGYDHVGHFSMVFQTRAQGGLVTALGLGPDGSDWIYANYPQQLHAVATALADLFNGPALSNTAGELLLYGRSLAFLQILTAIMLAAGVAQLSGLRRRPLLAWPLAGILVGAFTLGPGIWALSEGYPNFVFSCATAGLAALLAVPMRGRLVPARVFALGGLVVATVHGWALIGPIAVVAACVAFLPLGRARWPESWRGRITLVAALTATAAASIMVVPLLVSIGGMDVLNLGLRGDIWYDLNGLSLAPFAGGAAMAVALALFVRRRTSESAWKGIGLAAVSATALLVTGALVTYQLRTGGAIAYYSYKMLRAVVLTSAAVLVAALALHAGALGRIRRRTRTSVAIIASILATVAVLGMFGSAGGLKYYFSDAPRILASSEAQGKAWRISEAAAIAEERPFGTTYYLATLSDDPLPFFADQWQRSLSMMFADAAAQRGYVLLEVRSGMEPAAYARVTEKLLAEGPDIAVVVAPEVADPLRDVLPADLRARVLTW